MARRRPHGHEATCGTLSARTNVLSTRSGAAGRASDPSSKTGHRRSWSVWRLTRPMHHGTYRLSKSTLIVAYGWQAPPVKRPLGGLNVTYWIGLGVGALLLPLAVILLARAAGREADR